MDSRDLMKGAALIITRPRELKPLRGNDRHV
jgi:hypothetical protein